MTNPMTGMKKNKLGFCKLLNDRIFGKRDKMPKIQFNKALLTAGITGYGRAPLPKQYLSSIARWLSLSGEEKNTIKNPL